MILRLYGLRIVFPSALFFIWNSISFITDQTKSKLKLFVLIVDFLSLIPVINSIMFSQSHIKAGNCL